MRALIVAAAALAVGPDAGGASNGFDRNTAAADRPVGGRLRTVDGRRVYVSDPTARLQTWTDAITQHTLLHENVKKLMEGFQYDAHPMGIFISTIGALPSARASDGTAAGRSVT